MKILFVLLHLLTAAVPTLAAESADRESFRQTITELVRPNFKNLVHEKYGKTKDSPAMLPQIVDEGLELAIDCYLTKLEANLETKYVTYLYSCTAIKETYLPCSNEMATLIIEDIKSGLISKSDASTQLKSVATEFKACFTQGFVNLDKKYPVELNSK